MTVIGPDVSFYDDDDETTKGIDFVKMSTVSAFVIIKAGQGNYADSDFYVNWGTSKLAGLPRGTYWYYDSRVSPIVQAEKYYELVKNDSGELPLFLDIEETYGGTYTGWTNWKKFLDRLMELLPNKEIGIYTAYYYWKDNAVDMGADLTYFGQFSLWVANYGVSSPLLPTGWSDWLFWQYTDKGDGSYYGTESSTVDLNYFNGTLDEFYSRFNITGEVPSYTVKDWWGGVAKEYYGYETDPNPFYYHVIKFRKSVVTKVFTNGSGFLGTSKYFWETRGKPDIVINGDEGSPIAVKALGCSEGNIYKLSNGETSIQWDKDNNILGMSIKPLENVWTACGGSNILLENGELHWSILDEAPEPDPRTSLFWNDEYYFIIIIDGRNNGTLGLSKQGLARFALKWGATDGHNLDGGDSCQALMNNDGTPVIINNPPDNYLHGVVNHVGFILNKEAIPPEGENMLVKVLLKTRKRNKPSFYGDAVGDVLVGESFEYLSKTDTTEKVPAGGPTYTVTWYEVASNQWVAKNHYNNGEVYLEEVNEPPVELPNWDFPDALELEAPEGFNPEVRRYVPEA